MKETMDRIKQEGGVKTKSFPFFSLKSKEGECVTCRMSCEHGFKKDDKGCDICECEIVLANKGSEMYTANTLLTVQEIIAMANHPVSKAFALVGVLSLFYMLHRCTTKKSEYDILGRHKSYSSVSAEEEEI